MCRNLNKKSQTGLVIFCFHYKKKPYIPYNDSNLWAIPAVLRLVLMG